MRSWPPSALALAVLLLPACFVDGGAPLTGASTTDEEATTHAATAGSSGDPSGGATTTGTSTPTATSESTSTSASTSTSSATGTTTDESAGTTAADAPSLELACAAYCDALAACGQGSDPACVALCVAEATNDPNPSPACVEAAVDLLLCASDLSCDMIQQPAIGCPVETFAVFTFCPACKASTGGDTTLCTVELQCQVDLYAAECDENGCICLKNREIVGQCVLGATPCGMANDTLIDVASGCCSWPE